MNRNQGLRCGTNHLRPWKCLFRDDSLIAFAFGRLQRGHQIIIQNSGIFHICNVGLLWIFRKCFIIITSVTLLLFCCFSALRLSFLLNVYAFPQQRNSASLRNLTVPDTRFREPSDSWEMSHFITGRLLLRLWLIRIITQRNTHRSFPIKLSFCNVACTMSSLQAFTDTRVSLRVIFSSGLWWMARVLPWEVLPGWCDVSSWACSGKAFVPRPLGSERQKHPRGLGFFFFLVS